MSKAVFKTMKVYFWGLYLLPPILWDLVGQNRFLVLAELWKLFVWYTVFGGSLVHFVECNTLKAYISIQQKI